VLDSYYFPRYVSLLVSGGVEEDTYLLQGFVPSFNVFVIKLLRSLEKRILLGQVSLVLFIIISG